ncbi:hypothetical protein EON63_02160 [archaeon]|nr:MAG: hypothetical protein EON63_02160 [archaeon]
MPSHPSDLTVHAKIVVSSAGALHTPVLLIKSGLKDPHIGSHLCLHPVVGAGGLHSKDKVCVWIESMGLRICGNRL